MRQYKILVDDAGPDYAPTERAPSVLAARGKEAIAVFQKERPNLTILDIDMLDVDGITVLRQIRTIDPQAKVMVFTGGESPIVESQAKALGVSLDFSEKASHYLRLPSSSLVVRSPQSETLAYAPE